MRIRKVGGDRFKTVWVTEDGKSFNLQRYPTSRHAAWRQIALYQKILKGVRVGEWVEIEDRDAVATIERAIRAQNM